MDPGVYFHTIIHKKGSGFNLFSFRLTQQSRVLEIPIYDVHTEGRDESGGREKKLKADAWG